MKAKTIVLGLGNPLMGDEGIGTALIECLSRRGRLCDDVEFLDAGTGGVTLLHLLEGRDRAILIDCAKMGERPGTIRRFTPDDVASVKQLAHQSLHEADIMRLIEMARELGQCPKEIVIFGVEPQTVEPVRKLSAELAGKLDSYVETVLGELAQGPLTTGPLRPCY